MDGRGHFLFVEPDGTRLKQQAERQSFPALRNLSVAESGISSPDAPAAGDNRSRPPARDFPHQALALEDAGRARENASQMAVEEESANQFETLLAELAALREENEALRFAAKRVGITDETAGAVKHRCKFAKMLEDAPLEPLKMLVDAPLELSPQGSLENVVPSDVLRHVLPMLSLADAGVVAIVFRALGVPVSIRSELKQ